MKKTIFLETHNIRSRTGGLGVFNYELAKGLYELDFEDLELILNVDIPELFKTEFGDKFKFNKYSVWSRKEIFRTRKKYNLWHSTNQNTRIEPHFPLNYLLTIHDVNFVEEISEDMNHKKNKRFYSKIKRATAITYISEYAKEQTHRYFTIPKCTPEHVIYNGNPISVLLDLSAYSPEIISEKPFFYTIGDFYEKKNFASLVNMMRIMSDYNLIISGNNDKEYGEIIRKMISDNNLDNRVFLTGIVSEEAKQYYMKNCTAFLFPSIREGFGLPPIEAMRFKKPVFLSNKTSLPEVGGNAAFYWDNFDPEYMKEVLFEGLNDFENNRTSWEQKLDERASFFNWKKSAQQYLDLYRKYASE